MYHFMFDPDWEEGCKSCSFVAEHFGGVLVRLPAYDTSFAAISRAPITKIERYKKQMGWDFPWLSSFGTDFNYDFSGHTRRKPHRAQLRTRLRAPCTYARAEKERGARAERVRARW